MTQHTPQGRPDDELQDGGGSMEPKQPHPLAR